VRFVSDHHSTHLLRADWELAAPLRPDIEQALIRACLHALPRADAVVLSDYAKGVLSPAVIRAVIDKARELGKPVVVDPKGSDFTVYRGATLITPNRKELADATRHAARGDAEIAAAAKQLAAMVESVGVLVTRSEEGMTLYTVRDGKSQGRALHVPAYPVKVRDVSGAGDTVAAVMAVMLAAGSDFEQATRAANAAAAVVVGKRGTSTASTAELRSRLLPAASLTAEEKVIFDWSMLDERLAEWRGQGLRIGFTNGCFDLLHPGHVKLMTEARGACDRLVVGLNSDASVRRLKGKERPVQDQQARAEVLAALEAVDLVVIFGQDTPLKLIQHVRPTVLVKGGDYKPDQVVGREIVKALAELGARSNDRGILDILAIPRRRPGTCSTGTTSRCSFAPTTTSRGATSTSRTTIRSSILARPLASSRCRSSRLAHPIWRARCSSNCRRSFRRERSSSGRCRWRFWISCLGGCRTPSSI
jgi:D-beta-D-heptose 7-phosphate kinase/D-beta-D-heptose 1-phosphate adenosyltransferase